MVRSRDAERISDVDAIARVLEQTYTESASTSLDGVTYPNNKMSGSNSFGDFVNSITAGGQLLSPSTRAAF